MEGVWTAQNDSEEYALQGSIYCTITLGAKHSCNSPDITEGSGNTVVREPSRSVHRRSIGHHTTPNPDLGERPSASSCACPGEHRQPFPVINGYAALREPSRPPRVDIATAHRVAEPLMTAGMSSGPCRAGRTQRISRQSLSFNCYAVLIEQPQDPGNRGSDRNAQVIFQDVCCSRLLIASIE